MQQQQTAAAPKADKSVPLDQYKEIKSGKELMFTYLATTTMPIDYEKIAEEVSSDYRYSNDEFKKRDILNALKPSIDAEISKARELRYRYIDIGDQIEKYNFDSKSFPMSAFSSASAYRYFSDSPRYTLAFSNMDAYRNLPVPDESVARNIESLRSKYNGLYTRVYFFVAETKIGETKVVGEITKVRVMDAKNNLLAEL